MSEINKLIEAQLPKQVGEVLSKRLAAGEAAEKRVDELQEQIAVIQKELNDKNKQLAEIHGRVKRWEDIIGKEKEIENRERDLTLKMLELKLEESEKRTALSKEFVGMIFRGPVMKEHRSSYFNHNSMYNGNGG